MTQEEQLSRDQPLNAVLVAFEAYCQKAYGNEKLPPIQRQEIRKAFYAGMLINFHIMVEISNGFENEEMAMEAVDAHFQHIKSAALDKSE